MSMPFLKKFSGPKRGEGGVSVSVQHFSYEVLIYVINGYIVYLDICTAHSVRKKNDLIIETAWNIPCSVDWLVRKSNLLI